MCLHIIDNEARKHPVYSINKTLYSFLKNIKFKEIQRETSVRKNSLKN
jgi:hypothetical protein